MKKRILLAVISILLCYLAVDAQNYDRYYYFHEEAVKLKNEGKLNEAKEKFIKIKDLCKGGIPQDNDLDKMIRECTTISFSESNVQFEANGGQKKHVTVRTNANTFKARSDSDWCNVEKKGNNVSISCWKNDSPVVRNASVLVVADGKTMSFGVSQKGGQLEFEARPDSVNFSKLSETVGIAVETNALSWRVDSVPDWIECLTNDSMLYLKSAQNDLAKSRETTVYIVAFDELFPIYVRQAESDTVISANKKELVFPCSEAEDQITVESNSGQWHVTTNEDWIKVLANQNMVTVRVEQNESLFSRHGKIMLGTGNRFCEVSVHQYAYASKQLLMDPEIKDEESVNEGFIITKSVPSDLKVTILNDIGESVVRYTPFELPVDYSHYSLLMGFERRELFANEQQQDVVFEPGFRFATITWSPKTAIGMMSGFVGAKSWGAYAHFGAQSPFPHSFDSVGVGLAGYSMTIGPVFRHNRFPYVGAYGGIGLGAYAGDSHLGLDFEAGVMGFYKNLMLTLGFHTSRLTSDVQNTSFTMGIGGYLKRYYDSRLGYCASDSRRWFSLNYVFRPAENGIGLMVGDLGKERVRVYLKAMYLPSMQTFDSLNNRRIEGSAGIVFTPVNGLIDMTLGASAVADISGVNDWYRGAGVELGAILNVWRFPVTIMLHESDLMGVRHLYVDFGIGFHLGEFEKSKCSYQ